MDSPALTAPFPARVGARRGNEPTKHIGPISNVGCVGVCDGGSGGSAAAAAATAVVVATVAAVVVAANAADAAIATTRPRSPRVSPASVLVWAGPQSPNKVNFVGSMAPLATPTSANKRPIMQLWPSLAKWLVTTHTHQLVDSTK